ncbi:MAG: NMD3-related protein [Candidatus Nanoarchaeia archaeon]
MNIKAKFCAVCGNQKSKFIDSTCLDCYFNSLQIEIPKAVTIYACPVCDAVKSKGLWHTAPEPHESYFIQTIAEKLKLPPHVELENIEILQQNKEGKIEIFLSIKGKRFSIVKPIKLYVVDKVCEADAKRKRQAYEGILQLRTQGNVHEFLNKTESSMKEFIDDILKINETRNGADVYFLDIEPMRHLAAKLKKRFNLYLKESAKVYGWDRTKNKPKYKITILARER